MIWWTERQPGGPAGDGMSTKRDAGRWARATFGDAELGHRQRTRRLVKVGTDLAAAAGASPARAVGKDDAALEAMYRFIRNDRVQPAKIAEAGFAATAARLEGMPTLLCIEDTTTLAYTHDVGDELGDVGAPGKTTTRGFLVHSVLVVDGVTGQTLGLLEQSYWSRDIAERGKHTRRRKRRYEDKESFKWEAASRRTAARLTDEVRRRVISVCDREADIYEYLVYKHTEMQRFIVRAAWDRAVAPDAQDPEATHVWAALERAPIAGTATVQVTQRGGRPARSASLTVRAAAVHIRRPHTRGNHLPSELAVNAVLAREEHPPAGVEPLEWLLFTSEPIDTPDQILTILRYYRLRWRIEEFHKAWKSGAGVERRRMQTAGNLQRIAVVLAFVAVRLLQLRETLEATPEARCDSVLSTPEWQVLWVTVERRRRLPKRAPTVQWAYRALGRLAGWHDSKHTGRMGWESFWRGWEKLMEHMEGYRAAMLLARR